MLRLRISDYVVVAKGHLFQQLIVPLCLYTLIVQVRAIGTAQVHEIRSDVTVHNLIRALLVCEPAKNLQLVVLPSGVRVLGNAYTGGSMCHVICT